MVEVSPICVEVGVPHNEMMSQVPFLPQNARAKMAIPDEVSGKSTRDTPKYPLVVTVT